MPEKYILVVEDNNENVQRIVTVLLSIFGGDCKVCINSVCGADYAMPILKYCKVNLILLDMDMPDGSGEDLLNFMKENNMNISVMTASEIPGNNIRMAGIYPVYLTDKYKIMDGLENNYIKSILI